MNRISFVKVKDASRRPVRGLYKRGPSFYARIAIDKKITWVRLEANTLDEASEARRQIGKNGIPKKKETPAFKEFGDRYLTLIEKMKKRSTVSGERDQMRGALTPFFGKMRLDEITPAHVEEFRAMRLKKDEVTPNTVNHNIVVLRNVFKKAKVLLALRNDPFAGIALRDAAKWDTSPLVGSNVFLRKKGDPGLSDSLRELAGIANAQTTDGQSIAWEGILDRELSFAVGIQRDFSALEHRELEQAVVTTFLHSQPIGQKASLRELRVTIAPTNPDRIELEKGLSRWAQESYWLDDKFTATEGGALPEDWRLGNKPNLTQIHREKKRGVESDKGLIAVRLDKAIGDVKKLTEGAGGNRIREDGVAYSANLHPNELQDLSDNLSSIMELQAKHGIKIQFNLTVEATAEGTMRPEVSTDLRKALDKISDAFH